MLSAALAIGVFTVAPQAEALGPDAPTVLTPAAGEIVDGLVELTWNRPTGAVEFDVRVDDAADFATPLVSISNTTNLRYVPTVELPAGRLWWQVRASDGTTESGWVTEEFDHQAKSAPDPIRPLAGTTIQPPTDTPRFAWRPVQGATSYRLEVGPDESFTDPALVISSNQKSTAAVLTGYQVPGPYYWRVKAVLSNGYSTEWSPSLLYTVEGLPAATHASPEDNNFDKPVREVALDWNPVPGAVSYDLEIGTDQNFLSTVHSRAGIVGTRYSPPDGLDNDEYYWRVRPVDASGNKAPWPAEPWHFRRAWPDQPHKVHPRGEVSGGVPFFYEWDPIEMASSYTVYLYDETGRQICAATTVHTTLANACPPPGSGLYAWKVLARDEGGKWPEPVTDVIGQDPTWFTWTAGTPPAGSGPLTVDMVTGHAASVSATTAYAPAADRDACTATLPATCVDVPQTPVLTWDPVDGAVRYRLTLARDPQVSNVVDTFTVNDPIFTFTKTLPDSQAGSAYFWVVQPCWTTSLCAPIQHARHSFAKKTVAPLLDSPLSTEAEPAVRADDVTLDWQPWLAAQAERDTSGSSLSEPATTEAMSYVVETSLNASFNTLLERVVVDQTTFTSYANTYPEGTVYWRVQALDGWENPSVWSETGSFTKASSAPRLTTPADGAALGADYAFSWEPLEFAAGYDIDVFAGPTRVAGASAWKHASWAPSDPLPASPDEYYTWRVRRVDAKGRRGAWSDAETERWKVYPPSVVPSVVAPATGTTVPPSTAFFSWQPDDRASSYRFERRRAGTTSLTESITTRSTAWAPTSTIAAGTWEWRVVTLDTRGVALGASPWREFKVVDPPAVVTPVSIAGSGEVGTELRVSAPTFDPQVDSVSYQWYRGTTKLTGATGELYTVTPEDLGKSLTVRATGVLAGYKPAVTASDPIGGATGAALVAAHPPSIVGAATVGQTLTLDKGVWPAEPKLTYQWYRAGEAISRATAATYRLVPADAGRQIHVVETATAAGRAPGTATSSAVQVAKLPSTTALTLSATRTTPRKRVTASVTVLVSGLPAPGGSVKLYDGRRELKTVPLTTSTIQVRLPRLSKGKHVIKAVYSGGEQAKRSAKSARLVVKR